MFSSTPTTRSGDSCVSFGQCAYAGKALAKKADPGRSRKRA